MDLAGYYGGPPRLPLTVPTAEAKKEIEEAFAASRACLIILSAEFTTGKWATTEMHTAITKRVNEGYRVYTSIDGRWENPVTVASQSPTSSRTSSSNR